MTVLFKSARGDDVTAGMFAESLKEIHAPECDVLYIHTDMTFGLPVLKRNALLGELLEIIEKLGVKTIVFPVFTFSFCNGEIYDTCKTPSKMGALNEYARKNASGFRTEDPLLSVFVMGDPLNLAEPPSHESIGSGSTYDRLHHCGKVVRFLFLGADMRQCFTYTHYMEAVFSVPYRYNKEFIGDLIDRKGNLHKKEKYTLFSTYGNVRLSPIPMVYDTMKNRGQLCMTDIGDGNINCFTEKDAFCTISDLFNKNIYFLTDGTFDPDKKNLEYNPTHQRVVSVL